MEAITFKNIKIEGIDIKSLINLTINHTVNEHATVIIDALMDEDKALECEKKVDEQMLVSISNSAEGQSGTMFLGFFTGISIARTMDGIRASISLISTSILSDIQRGNKSFQNTSISHMSAISAVVGSNATIKFNVADQAIGHMIVQCNETPWDFAVRIASNLNAPVVTTICSQSPIFHIGMPTDSPIRSIEQKEIVADRNNKPIYRGGAFLITSRYVFVGDRIPFNSVEQYVYSVTTDMSTGVLVSTVEMKRKDNIVIKPIKNDVIAGKMFTGTVTSVSLDKVKVHITDLDASFDGSSNTEFPYSTAYSSADGSGFYCMPAVGDTVRIFFPSSDESKAFAASSVSVSSAAQKTYKQWTGPNGKQILLADDFIRISSNVDTQAVYIYMDDAKGISIASDKDITIAAKNNLVLMSNNVLSITAKNDILLSTADSFIDIKTNGIEIGAENVVIK